MIMIIIRYNVLQKRSISQKYKKCSPEKYALLLYVAVSIRWISIRFDFSIKVFPFNLVHLLICSTCSIYTSGQLHHFKFLQHRKIFDLLKCTQCVTASGVREGEIYRTLSIYLSIIFLEMSRDKDKAEEGKVMDQKLNSSSSHPASLDLKPTDGNSQFQRMSTKKEKFFDLISNLNINKSRQKYKILNFFIQHKVTAQVK